MEKFRAEGHFRRVAWDRKAEATLTFVKNGGSRARDCPT
jgi:Carbamate kinase